MSVQDHTFYTPFPLALATKCEHCGVTFEQHHYVAVVQHDGNAHYSAAVPGKDVAKDVCTHRHMAASAAEACARWETNARAKGESRWHGVKPARKAARAFPQLASVDGELASDAEMAQSHEYVPMPGLADLWHAMVTGAQKRPAGNLLFTGPSGSGKTDGARYLAGIVGLPFAKVDAASMTDPEAWFGTREIVVQDGVAVTDYKPSAFIESVQKPGVTLVDEITRVRDEHRNVLLPLLDATRCVLNPLTGEIVRRHPQNFIVMAGNVGVQFTGTSAVDPAFTSRARKVEFDYIDSDTEQRVVRDASGCDDETAYVLVRFATESRAKAKNDPEFTPISTRELIETGRDVADGLDRDAAVRYNILNGTSSEGGSSSLRQEMQSLWNGVRTTKLPQKATPKAASAASGTTWTCPTHGQSKLIPAGVSQRTGKAYPAFNACPVFGCQNTEDKTAPTVAPRKPSAPFGSGITPQPTVNGHPVSCPDCGAAQPVGRTTICVSCGAALK